MLSPTHLFIFHIQNPISQPVMATEDFSFPTITDTFPCSVDWPPLSCLSPAASPPCHDQISNDCTELKDDQEKEEEEGSYSEYLVAKLNTKFSQRSLSSVEKNTNLRRRNNNFGEDDDKEEKMDMLWEDFNEELFKISHRNSPRVDSGRMVNRGCVHQKLRLSKTSGGSVISPGKPGLVAFMRVLKRLLLLHTSHHRSVKTDSSHRPIRNH